MTFMVFLPEQLSEKLNTILSRFNRLRDEWKSYPDYQITEEPKFAREIVQFLLDIVDYAFDNYDSIEPAQYREFLGTFHKRFSYGPENVNNYLDLKETVEGEKLSDFCKPLIDSETLAQEDLVRLKLKYMALLEKL